MMIIDHTHPMYRVKLDDLGTDRYNGAYYYSEEIVNNIIPRIKTDRNWVTVNVIGHGCDHAIVFVHNNLNPQNYDWLTQYRDLILICGIEETCKRVRHLGRTIYLPLSIDTEYVRQFRLPKEERSGIAYAGRPGKKKGYDFPEETVFLEGLPREQLLQEMARFETVFAVGRTAIEAKCLGCKLKAYDERFPMVSRWKVFDNKKAAKMLQEKLDEIEA